MPDVEKFIEDLRDMLPVAMEEMNLDKDIPKDAQVELVVVDVVKGFTRKGALAAPELMEPMVEAINVLAMKLIRKLGGRLHVTMFQDCHSPDVPEPPYPRHCTWDTDEPEIDPDLQWLASMPNTMLIKKDCTNGMIGSFRHRSHGDYANNFLQHMLNSGTKTVIVVGDCTDICVSDFVTSLLSARNAGLLTSKLSHDKEYADEVISFNICVFEPGCATYHYDPGSPMPGRHPEDVAHHVGLWTMASRGAKILSKIK